RIARNLALNRTRDQKAREGRDKQGGELFFSRPPQTPSDYLEANSIRADVEQAIATLPPRRREVFILSRFHGLTHQEIADALGTSKQTVANQLTTGLAELRIALAERLADAGMDVT